MLNRLQPLENGQLATLHNACMNILSKVGVVFHDAEALEIFKEHGFKVDGKKVFFSEDKVLKALETMPSEFTIQARNPETLL
jgi:trimethylamine--corrinoid protein Co-methyltransferase